MTTELSALLKAEVIAAYRAQKELADAALTRTTEAAFFARLGTDTTSDSNSMAVLVKHLSGNLRSRWTDFLTSDGEKADRQREREFMTEAGDERQQIITNWEESWRILFAALEALTADDFLRTITIRGEPHNVVQAILRNLTHATHHIGQLDLLATVLEER